jgi:hypothetical protein
MHDKIIKVQITHKQRISFSMLTSLHHHLLEPKIANNNFLCIFSKFSYLHILQVCVCDIYYYKINVIYIMSFRYLVT